MRGRGDIETLAEGHVEIPEPGLTQQILLLRRGEGPRGRGAVGIAIEPDGAVERRIPISPRGNGVVRYLIVELVSAARPDARNIDAGGRANVERRTRLRLEDARDVPVAEHPPQRRH